MPVDPTDEKQPAGTGERVRALSSDEILAKHENDPAAKRLREAGDRALPNRLRDQASSLRQIAKAHTVNRPMVRVESLRAQVALLDEAAVALDAEREPPASNGHEGLRVLIGRAVPGDDNQEWCHVFDGREGERKRNEGWEVVEVMPVEEMNRLRDEDSRRHHTAWTMMRADRDAARVDASVRLTKNAELHDALEVERRRRVRLQTAIALHQDALDRRAAGDPEMTALDRDDLDNALYNISRSLNAGEPDATAVASDGHDASLEAETCVRPRAAGDSKMGSTCHDSVPVGEREPKRLAFSCECGSAFCPPNECAVGGGGSVCPGCGESAGAHRTTCMDCARDERIEKALATWYSDKGWSTSYTRGEADHMRETMGKVLDRFGAEPVEVEQDERPGSVNWGEDGRGSVQFTRDGDLVVEVEGHDTVTLPWARRLKIPEGHRRAIVAMWAARSDREALIDRGVKAVEDLPMGEDRAWSDLARIAATAVVDALAGAVPPEPSEPTIAREALSAMLGCGFAYDPSTDEWEAPIGEDGQEGFATASQALQAAFKAERAEVERLERHVAARSKDARRRSDGQIRLRRELDRIKSESFRVDGGLPRSWADDLSELERLRASKPLSTDVLRNPPLDLCVKADGAVSGPFGFVTPAKATRARQAVFGVLIDWLDEHSSPSLPPDEVPLGCNVQSFSSAVCSRGTKCCVMDHDEIAPGCPPPSPAEQESVTENLRRRGLIGSEQSDDGRDCEFKLFFGSESWPGAGWVVPTGMPGEVNLIIPIEGKTPPLAQPPWPGIDTPHVAVTFAVADLLATLRLPSPAVGLTVDGGVAAIAAERQRQVESEGWTSEHDDAHADGDLAEAAACYAIGGESDTPPDMWPWEPRWWKPGGRLRNLEKAGALIAAEHDRETRLAAVSEGPDEGSG